MILDETELKLKEDIDIIFSGGYDDKLSPEQIDYIKKLSFLYNHLEINIDSVTFTYNDVKFKISGIGEIPDVYRKHDVLSALRNSDEFKSAYLSFCREYKISNILD